MNVTLMKSHFEQNKGRCNETHSKSNLDSFTEKTELSDVEFFELNFNPQAKERKVEKFKKEEADIQMLKEKLMKEFEPETALKIFTTADVQLHKLMEHMDTDLNKEILKFHYTYNILKEKSQNILKQTCKWNGVSSTANSIIGRKECITSSSSKTVKNASVVIHTAQVNDLTVNVVDVPGIDTDNSSEEVLLTLQTYIEKSFTLCGNTFTAFILVLRYGQRFTKQEKDTLKFITAIFGKDVIKNNIICVFTHGDMFENYVKHIEDILTFESWCKEQKGPIKGLLEKCNYKCLLFNNVAVEKEILTRQVNELLTLTRSTEKYSLDDFKEADKWLKPLKNEIALPKMRQITIDFLTNKRSELLQLEIKHKDNLSVLIDELEKLLNELQEFEGEITKEVGEILDERMHPVKLLRGLKLQIKSKIDLKRYEEKLSEIHKQCNPIYLANRTNSLEVIKKYREPNSIRSVKKKCNANKYHLTKKNKKKFLCYIL
ncbi:hypothetical protein Btru_048245 [Bulinus truncatus]|nr:hypothetical protein Btru_048245 [Bulinus truncatus]